MEVPSIRGSRYVITLIDDHSHWVVIYAINEKSETTECYLDYEKFVERHTGKKFVRVRSDRGPEYIFKTLQSHFRRRGIIHQITLAYTPSQYGVAERLNRTLIKLSLPLAKTRVHIWNKRPSIVSHVRAFCCRSCYALPKHKLCKLDARGTEANFIGYAEFCKTYSLLDLESGM